MPGAHKTGAAISGPRITGGNFKDTTLFPELGSVFGRTDFSRIFNFGPPDFFADSLAGFFLLIFVGKKGPEKSSRKISGKILQNLHHKNPRHISAEGPAQYVA